jgi:hypothetical protein
MKKSSVKTQTKDTTGADDPAEYALLTCLSRGFTSAYHCMPGRFDPCEGEATLAQESRWAIQSLAQSVKGDV